MRRSPLPDQFEKNGIDLQSLLTLPETRRGYTQPLTIERDHHSINSSNRKHYFFALSHPGKIQGFAPGLVSLNS
jgi:hypothetical protein